MSNLTFNKTIETLIAAIKDVREGNHTSASYGLLVVKRYGNKQAIATAVAQQPAVQDLLSTVGE